MSALYVMNYVGATGLGSGVVYVGKGTIIGVDAHNALIKGSYSEQDGRLMGEVILTARQDSVLVTGDTVPAGASVPIALDMGPDFANGNPQQLSVAGKPVEITFEKLGDVP